MGAFYTNLTLNTTHRDAAVAHCTAAKRTAFVSTVEHGACVIFDEQGDDDPEGFAALAADLSAQCHCAALVVTNHDDDVLLYTLFQHGEVLDEYVSSPEFVAEFGEEGSEEATAALSLKHLGRPSTTARSPSCSPLPSTRSRSRALGMRGLWSGLRCHDAP